MVIATVAHELRGPLSALETASELLDRDFDLLDAQQVKVMVSSIHRRALWLRGLMENLLCAATADDGRLQIHARPVELRGLIEDARLLMDPLLKRKAQQLRMRTRPMLPFVGGDGHKLSQVMLNLLSNASKYSGDGTTIEVGVTMRSGLVRVTVADRGPGVASEHAAHLFEAYDRAGRTDGDGLGIGLSVVRSIIEAHGGRVGYADRAGGGAIFWFELAPMETALRISADQLSERGMVG
jgi:two-component system sensor histidine kinase KdpD